MPLPPAIPIGGLAGLRFLDRTYDRQFEVFNKSPDINREIAHFLENAGNIETVDQLMADRRVLGVVLGAYGLDDDIDKRAFIRKVIEEGTFTPEAFANRLVEPAYREMTDDLGFGNFGGKLVLETKRREIVARFKERQFELAVGDVDLDLRLALNFRREAVAVVDRIANPNSAWLGLLGSKPLRAVLEGALNLPTEFGSIDLDQQVGEIKRRAEDLFDVSKPKDLLADGVVDRMVERFLANSQLRNGSIGTAVRGTTALTLLQSGGLGTGGGTNLFASNFV